MNVVEFSTSTSFAIAGSDKKGYNANMLCGDYGLPKGFGRTMMEIAAQILKDEYPGVTIKEVMGSRRIPAIVEARHHIWTQIYYERPDLALSQIGRTFKRDHTTVLWAVRRFSESHPDKFKGFI